MEVTVTACATVTTVVTTTTVVVTSNVVRVAMDWSVPTEDTDSPDAAMVTWLVVKVEHGCNKAKCSVGLATLAEAATDKLEAALVRQSVSKWALAVVVTCASRDSAVASTIVKAALVSRQRPAVCAPTVSFRAPRAALRQAAAYKLPPARLHRVSAVLQRHPAAVHPLV